MILIEFKNCFQKSCKTKKKISANKVKSSNYKLLSRRIQMFNRLTCKIIRSVFYREKHVNQSLKMQNKWNSFVKERSFTQIL